MPLANLKLTFLFFYAFKLRTLLKLDNLYLRCLRLLGWCIEFHPSDIDVVVLGVPSKHLFHFLHYGLFLRQENGQLNTSVLDLSFQLEVGLFVLDSVLASFSEGLTPLFFLLRRCRLVVWCVKTDLLDLWLAAFLALRHTRRLEVARAFAMMRS